MGAGASAAVPGNSNDAESVMVPTLVSSGKMMAGQSYYIEPSKCINLDLQVEVSRIDAAVVALPRGGVLVNYGKGTVQFGLPPETIKDSLSWGLSVPTTFVILGEEMFDRQLGINIAEFEFPAYFNFFVFGKRVTLITTKNVEDRVRRIFQETLLGPKPGSYDLSEDFASDLPGGMLSKSNQATHWPDFTLEGLALDKQRETITVDALLNFANIDEPPHTSSSMHAWSGEKQNPNTVAGGASAPDGDKNNEDDPLSTASELDDVDNGASRMMPTGASTHVHGTEMDDSIARLADVGKVILDKERNTYVKYNAMLKKYTVREGKRTIAQVDYRFLKPRIKPRRAIQHEPFDIPLFGVTMLGASHGFDPKGTTTGFVVWVNRRGIMVDPPPDSAQVLRDLAIPARLIDGMILTHCHADHDAGAFQKILAESSIKIYTTQTIMDSFIRKYSAISNLDANFLRGLFVFERVKIGETKTIHNGEWNFHYSLHVIPTIGFEVKFKGEGLVYSGDTCTSPKLFERMRREKKIGAGRYEDLVKRSPVARHRHPHRDVDGSMTPGYAPHILHEAGVPPIHTPLETLARLPKETRERLFVVHVDQKQLSDGKFARKLKTIPQWATMHISVGQPEVDETTSSLEPLLSTVSFFRVLRSPGAIEALLDLSLIKFYSRGTVLLTAGDTWDRAYIVRAGVAHEGQISLGGRHSASKFPGSHPFRTNSNSDEPDKRVETSGAEDRADSLSGSSSGVGLVSDQGESLMDAIEGVPSALPDSEEQPLQANNPKPLPSVNEDARLESLRVSYMGSMHKPTRYYVGDMFGEESLMVEDQGHDNFGGGDSQRSQAVRTVQHDIVALTDLYTLELPRESMLPYLQSTELGRTILENLNTVARARCMETWNTIRLNATLERTMTRVQQQEFQKLLTAPRKLGRHEVLFPGGIKQEYVYLVSSGVVNFFCRDRSAEVDSAGPDDQANQENVDFVAGALLGDVNCLKDNTIAHHVLTSKSSSVVYEIARIDMLNFLNRFPGVKLQCIDRKYVV
ncbi:cGMP-dependent 3',5'-cGMP phosphodiesterase A [Hondaea fermentalgiana]|uniref:cGMP-dependent 3',5'-cGMP phosphodiesterase A n=1 Tax=Hondaea fermentalgiana TaxID=2315210 RepID=A0A2R5FYT1_9STRA|nr:cGMP-dependent 3',5'-cGMP phosphodiesterase A [Hondaea fermentalgiana]|eukprot:GBG23912.1 cGMP-dependent 3',5'-cGMP phosphodiesterase A [Hondaea fermentalgiana]